MTEHEAEHMLGGIPPSEELSEVEEPLALLDDETDTTDDLPDSIDWREKGAVNPVKNQRRCGSCWAFGVTASVEAAYFIKNGKLLDLSEEQIVACNSPPNLGCRGGFPHEAFKYLKEHG